MHLRYVIERLKALRAQRQADAQGMRD